MNGKNDKGTSEMAEQIDYVGAVRKTLRCVEFYCGIGGMHYGLKEARPDVEVVAAVDINPSALSIYEHNLGSTKVWRNNIQAISLDQMRAWNADVWTMSPPCQPFTKKGLQKGKEDDRCASLCALLESLSLLETPPTYIFVENVVGFETTTMHDDLLRCLRDRDYNIQQFIICPTQCGVPNRRPRFYLLARRKTSEEMESSLTLGLLDSSEIMRQLPNGQKDCRVEAMSGYLDDKGDSSLWLEEQLISKYKRALSVVTRLSRTSACFTKSYSHYVTGCGSVVCEDDDVVDEDTLKIRTEKLEDSPLSVRWMSPREVSNLMCFPASFEQPPGVTRRQMYKTLGNSVNVRVVSLLLKYLLFDM